MLCECKTWYDGICKRCESPVEETYATKNDVDTVMIEDLMNRCSNPLCEHHRWHPVTEGQFLDYYTHKKNNAIHRGL